MGGLREDRFGRSGRGMDIYINIYIYIYIYINFQPNSKSSFLFI